MRTPVVVIGNNRYSGHLFSQNLRPRLDDGELWLYTVHARRHLAVLRMMLQSLVGRLDEADSLAAEPATEIVIESDSGPLPVAADGEVLELSAPLRFRIRPGALRVIAPGIGGQRTEDGEQRTEDRGQRSDDRSLAAASIFRFQVSLPRFREARTEDKHRPASRPERRALRFLASGFRSLVSAFRFQVSGLRFPRSPEAQR